MPIKSGVTGYGWLASVIVLVLMSVLDRSLLYGLVDQLRHEFRLSDADIGLLTGVYFLWPALAGNLAGGVLADYTSKPRIIVGAAVLWGIATLVSGFAESFRELVAARIVVGFAQGMAAPTFLALIGLRTTKAWLPFALGWYSIGGTLGYGVALAATSSAITSQMTGSWREPFVIFGALTIGVGVASALTLSDAKVPAAAPRMPDARRHLNKNWLLLFLVFAVALGLLAGVHFAFHSWLPTAMKRRFAERGTFDQAALGLAISLGGGTGCLFWTLAASLWTKAGRPEASLWILIAATLATAPFLLVAPLAPNVKVGLLLAGFAAMGTQVSSALSHATMQSLTPSAFRGRVAAANMLSVTGLSSLITWLVGLISTRSDHEGGSLSIELAISSGAALLLSVTLLIVTALLYQRLHHSSLNIVDTA